MLIFLLRKLKNADKSEDFQAPNCQSKCTMHLNQSFIDSIDLSFARPRHQRKWSNLDAKVQNNATELLDLNVSSWKDWTISKYSRTTFDDLNLDQHEFLTPVLDCSPKLWGNDECGQNSWLRLYPIVSKDRSLYKSDLGWFKVWKLLFLFQWIRYLHSFDHH